MKDKCRERRFKFEASVLSTVFADLMQGRWREQPCHNYCPHDITLFIEAVYEKAYAAGYQDCNSEMESLYFERRSKDDGFRYATNKDICDLITKLKEM